MRDTKINTSTIEDHKDSFTYDENIINVIEYTENQKMIGNMLKRAGEKCKKLLTAFYYEKLSIKLIFDRISSLKTALKFLR